MAYSLNKVQLIGNLGRDPEVRFTQDGRAIANLSVATSESWKDNQGVPQERTEWHRVVIFGKLAEIAQQYARKGGKIYVEGKLRTNKWTDKQGQERYTTEILIDFDGTIILLDSNRSGAMETAPAGVPEYGPGDMPQAAQYPGQGGRSTYTAAPKPAMNPTPANRGYEPPPASPDFNDDIPF